MRQRPRVRWPIAIVWLLVFMACVYGWITYVLLDCSGDFETHDSAVDLAPAHSDTERLAANSVDLRARCQRFVGSDPSCASRGVHEFGGAGWA